MLMKPQARASSSQYALRSVVDADKLFDYDHDSDVRQFLGLDRVCSREEYTGSQTQSRKAEILGVTLNVYSR